MRYRVRGTITLDGEWRVEAESEAEALVIVGEGTEPPGNVIDVDSLDVYDAVEDPQPTAQSA